MRRRFSMASLCGMALIAVLAGCDSEKRETSSVTPRRTPKPVLPPPVAPPATFTLGVAGPFTGSSSEFGAQVKMAVELFAEQLNAAGGINGRKLKLNEQDDAGKAADAQTVASTLASDESVLAVIGHFNSSCSLNGKPIYTQAKMVMFSPASTNVEVTSGSQYIYRNIFTDKFQGESLAQYAGAVLGLKNIAILFDNDDYGAGLKESFKKRAGDLGIRIVAEEAYNKEQPDFRAQVATLHGTQPPPDGFVVAGLYNEAANIVRNAREIGVTAQFLGGDGVFSQQYITLAGNAAEGSYVTCPFIFELGGEKATRFAEAFRKKYNRDPDAWSALSYDAISIVCEGIKKNGFTRDAVLQYLKTVDSPEHAFDGLTGKTFFDAQGDCKKPVQVAQVKGGKFVAAEKQLGPDGKAATVKGASTATSHDTTPTSAGQETTPLHDSPQALQFQRPPPAPESAIAPKP